MPRSSARKIAPRVLAATLIAAAIFYAAPVAALAVFQRSLLYFPDDAVLAPAGQGALGVEDLRIATADHETLRAWWRAPEPGKPILLFFDGNGMRLDRINTTPRFIAAARKGVGLLAIAYRGFSGSTGAPTEAGLHEDARSAYRWLLARGAAPRNIIVEGYSLGSGVAVRLAAERPVGALILESPFTTMGDVAIAHFPFTPMSELMPDQFRSRDWIGRVHAPTLIVHGDSDRLIPISEGLSLYALANEPKTFVRMPGSGHTTLVADGLYEHVWIFLDALPIGPDRIRR
jgi:pimeloyl-ACP methyl ester carboxylesterase